MMVSLSMCAPGFSGQSGGKCFRGRRTRCNQVPENSASSSAPESPVKIRGHEGRVAEYHTHSYTSLHRLRAKAFQALRGIPLNAISLKDLKDFCKSTLSSPYLAPFPIYYFPVAKAFESLSCVPYYKVLAIIFTIFLTNSY